MRLLYLTLFFLISNFSTAQEFNDVVLSARLQKKISASQQDYININILLADRVDTKTLNEEFIRNKVSLKERAFTLITSLQTKAKTTQTPILDLLKTSPKVVKESIHEYWITNLIFARVHKSVIGTLSKHPDVDWIDLSVEVALSDYKEEAVTPATLLTQPNGREPGLTAVNAPALWAMGYTGYGTSALILDTGTDPTHPALQTQHGFNNNEKEEIWFDIQESDPNDCRSHGTHVCGTVLGIDRMNKDTIGVAFNAQWTSSPMISCYLQDTTSTSTERLVNAFQWSLDPDGDPTTIDDMPDAINNSWFDPFIEMDECTSLYFPTFNALEASGIAVAFSAGNAGPLPMTITPPHNINTDLVNSFTVAAVNGNLADLPIADFSSRGPSLCGGEGSILIKPEVSAPGENVRSSVPGGGYANFSGTSMACPHTVGAILLLKEAFPELTGTDIKLSLYFSAVDLGEPGEDNTFGMGIIDVLAAYNYLIDQGHTPVAPETKENDLILVNIDRAADNCDSQTGTTTIVIENGGENEVTNFNIDYSLTGPELISDTYNWTGNLGSGEQITIDLPSLIAAEGKYVFAASISGAADDRMLNNTIKRDIFINEDEHVSAYTEISTAPVCESADVMLRSDYEGDGVVQWFLDPFDGNPIGIGNAIVLEDVSSNTTVYADVLFNKNTGMNTYTEGDNDLMVIEEERGLVFDAHAPFTLKSVMVFVEQPGVRFIKVKNSSGTEIFDRAISVPVVGPYQMLIDFDVPVGEDMQLTVSGGGRPFYFNTTGSSFPYIVDEVLTIKSGNNIDAPENYYYFYDWEIEHTQFCGRTAVDIEAIDPEGELPNAEFSVVDTIIDLNADPIAVFTDDSEGAVSWFWNFGDGTTSGDASPTHEYTTIGNYNVSLTITNELGCTDVYTRTVEVLNNSVSSTNDFDTSLESIDLYPNPTENLLYVSFDLQESRAIKIKVVDVLGRTLNAYDLQRIQNNTLQINVDQFENGVYYLLVELDGKQVAKKFMILR